MPCFEDTWKGRVGRSGADRCPRQTESSGKMHCQGEASQYLDTRAAAVARFKPEFCGTLLSVLRCFSLFNAHNNCRNIKFENGGTQ